MRFGFLLVIIFGAWTIAAAQSPAVPETRIALIITNQNYQSRELKLQNTHKDGDLVKAALEKTGFKVWVVKDTADTATLETAIADHLKRVAEAGANAVGFFYYSGHGAADGPRGSNYLIPTRATPTHAAQLPLVALSLDRITGSLAQAGKMSFVVFDACRNVPLERADKAVFKGFAPIRDQAGLLVAFATRPGTVAIDASIYARVLAEEMEKGGVEAGQMFRSVRRRVRLETASLREPQEPELLDQRDHDFVFRAVPPAPPPLSEVGQRWADIWADIKDSRDVRVFEGYRRQFGAANPAYDALAGEKIAALTPKPEPAPPVKKAEEKVAAIKVPPPVVEQPKPATPVVGVVPKACDGVQVAVSVPGRQAEQCIKPGSGQSFRDCDGCPEMVVVPSGTFMMGSPANEPERSSDEGPQREVTIAKPFAVGKFEVTFPEWDAYVADKSLLTPARYKPEDQGWGRGGDRPVINVSWDHIQDYLKWLSAKTGKSYRLLTEAEWEYAARAGTTTPFWWGKAITPEQANYDGSVDPYAGGGTEGEYRRKTMPVQSFKPNAWGLHQVHGNVWEWVQDCYVDSYKDAAKDGSPAIETFGCNRVLRGGSWNNNPGNLRAANRNRSFTTGRVNYIGFRVARTF